LFRFLNLVLEIQVRKLATKLFDFLLFCARPEQKVRTFFFYIPGESAFCAVQFTVPVFLGFTFHKTLELRGYKVADLLSMNPLGAP
jgi:hypothetical protein